MSTIIGGNLPGLEEYPITKCAVDFKGKKKVCSTKSEIKKMRYFLKNSGYTNKINELSDEEVIKKMLQYLNVDNEADIYKNPQFRRHIGGWHADKVLEQEFVPEGPADSTELINNFNIDNTLNQWAQKGYKKFKKKFYNIPFQMIDFMEQRTELSYLNIEKLCQEKYDCFGVIINTDVSSGFGKHWFAIYGDLMHAGTDEDPYTLEYFNSSGFPPRIQIITWMEKIAHDLARDYNKKILLINVMNGKRIQYSRTECGVWSLLYILSRLLGYPSQWLSQVEATDEDVIKYRKRLFR